MNGDALTPSGRQHVGRPGPVDEVELGRARQLFETERHLELPGAQLYRATRAQVHEDVSPWPIRVDLTLDLELDVGRHHPFHADPSSRQIESIIVSTWLARPIERIALEPGGHVQTH